jgi:hypothetical protein
VRGGGERRGACRCGRFRFLRAPILPRRLRVNSRVFEAARLGAVPGSLPPTTFGEDDLFPEDFAFGVASSAFQIEGDGGDRPRSTWDDFSDARGLGDAARQGIRHFEHVEDDIKYMARAGVKHYRLSLSWPRLQNQDGTPNDAGYAFYEKMLDAMQNAGIEPYVTLHHWDLPSAMCQGGTSASETTSTESCPAVDWLDPKSVDQFEAYASQAFARLGGRVRFWATLNEPKTVANLGYGVGAHAPGLQSATAPLVAGHNMLLAHAAAVRSYRDSFIGEITGGRREDFAGDQRGLARAERRGEREGRRGGGARDGRGARLVRGPVVFRGLPCFHETEVRRGSAGVHGGAESVA